jgi:hypothetical protein
MSDANHTLEEIQTATKSIGGGFIIDFLLAPNHERRTDALEKILDFIYNGLVEQRAQNYQLSEDALTVQIVQGLKLLGIQATHDQQNGGHCDITVEAADQYYWIGEAKIHTGYNWLADGFKQLSTRYGVAQPGRNKGEIIIYCKNKDARSVLENWAAKMRSDFPGTEIFEDNIGTSLRFRTQHKCQSSGLNFYTRHRILPLYFKPEK